MPANRRHARDSKSVESKAYADGTYKVSGDSDSKKLKFNVNEGRLSKCKKISESKISRTPAFLDLVKSTTSAIDLAREATIQTYEAAETSLTSSSSIKRAPNSFICFRSALGRSAVTQDLQTNLSKKAGLVWAAMTAEERAPFVELAIDMAQEHRRRFPDYVFAPVKKLPVFEKSVKLKKGAKKSARKECEDEDEESDDDGEAKYVPKPTWSRKTKPVISSKQTLSHEPSPTMEARQFPSPAPSACLHPIPTAIPSLGACAAYIDALPQCDDGSHGLAASHEFGSHEISMTAEWATISSIETATASSPDDTALTFSLNDSSDMFSEDDESMDVHFTDTWYMQTTADVELDDGFAFHFSPALQCSEYNTHIDHLDTDVTALDAYPYSDEQPRNEDVNSQVGGIAEGTLEALRLIPGTLYVDDYRFSGFGESTNEIYEDLLVGWDLS